MPLTVQDGTEEALLFDICRYPEDDGLRLIYADYLEEREREASLDRERAEFIRLQIEWQRDFASKRRSDDRCPDWHHRRAWLLDKMHVLDRLANDYTREEVRALTGIQDAWFLDTWYSQRGLLGTLCLRLKHLRDFAGILFTHYPLQEVRLLDRCPEHLPEGGWASWRACAAPSPWECRRPADLPPALYDLLEGGVANSVGERTYTSKELAWQDLSQACVHWARQQVFGPEEQQG